MPEQVYPEPTVGALIIKDGKVLLCKSPKFHGELIVPGGHVEVGETFEQALKREVREETGLEVEAVKMIAFYEAIFPKDFHKKKHFIFFDFECTVKGGKLKLDGRELTEAVWLAPEEALQRSDVEYYSKKTVEEYVKSRQKKTDGK